MKLYNQKLQNQLNAYLSEGNSQDETAKQIGISPAALSTYRSSNYAGNVSNVERKLEEFFRLAELKMEHEKKVALQYASVKYVPTSISQGVYNTIRYCQLERGIAVVFGDSGIGKTTAAKKYLQDNPSTCIYIRVTPVFGSLGSFLKELARKMRLPEKRSKDELVTMIREKIEGRQMQWYVLHVLTGEEQAACRALVHGGWDARAPRELCQERVRGEWIAFERVLFSGYVFVGLDAMTDAAWRDTLAIVRRRCSSARYLGIGTPQPISAAEAAYLGFLAPDANALPPSEIAFDAYGTPHIVSGPLLHLEGSIKRMNLRQRRALVTLPMLGKAISIRMAVTPAQPKGGDAP